MTATWIIVGVALFTLSQLRAGRLARLSWLTTGVANPDPPTAKGTAFLFRGQTAVFSPGFGSLCAALRSAGIRAEDLRCVGDEWAYRVLVDRKKRGEPIGPVILVGHSRGGRRALALAHRLAAVGVTVDLLICIDVAFPPAAPGNVRRAVHVYRSRYRLYPARPLQPAPGVQAAIENIDLDAADSPIRARWLPHFAFMASPAVRKWIAEQILAVCE